MTSGPRPTPPSPPRPRCSRPSRARTSSRQSHLLATYDARWIGTREPRRPVMGKTQGPAVSCKRKDVLRLSLDDYKRWRDLAVKGSLRKRENCWSASTSSPRRTYRTGPSSSPSHHLGPLLGRRPKAKAYGPGSDGGTGAVSLASCTAQPPDSLRQGRPEVIQWVNGGRTRYGVPGQLPPGRLHTMRSRQSAAYKGLYALLMRDGAKDFRTGYTIQVATLLQ